MKKIKLTRGKVVIVDDEDFEYLNQWKWACNKGSYAFRQYFNKEKYKSLTYKERWKANECIFMHRLINKTPDGFHTDHINRDQLDNRKENLRTATPSQNGINRGLQSNNTSGYKGISWYKNAWCVEIKLHQIKHYLGRFKNIEDAINARKQGELLYHNI